jgi:predicted transcriptional regulator
VTLALFYLHKYLFESHIKKSLSLKEEGEIDMESDT